MSKSARVFRIDEAAPPSAPLTAAEKAALKRAEADIKAGRLHDHDDVAKWLRQRATEIVGCAIK
jgi:predicted transcriptional regulator